MVEETNLAEAEEAAVEEAEALSPNPLPGWAQQLVRSFGRWLGAMSAVSTYAGMAGVPTVLGVPLGAGAIALGAGSRIAVKGMAKIARVAIKALPKSYVGRELTLGVLYSITGLDEGMREGDNLMGGINNAIGDVAVGTTVGVSKGVWRGDSVKDIWTQAGRDIWYGSRSFAPIRVATHEKGIFEGLKTSFGLNAGGTTPSLTKRDSSLYAGEDGVPVRGGGRLRIWSLRKVLSRAKSFAVRQLSKGMEPGKEKTKDKDSLKQDLGGEEEISSGLSENAFGSRKGAYARVQQALRTGEKYDGIAYMWEQAGKASARHEAAAKAAERPAKVRTAQKDEGLGL